MSDKYFVGQVLYIVPTAKRIVYPMKIVEEVTRKNLSSVNVEYVLQGNSTQKITLSEVEGKIYDSPMHVEKALIDAASRSIKSMVANAEETAKKWFGSPQSPSDMTPENDDLDSTVEETVVELPDGTKAKLKGPLPM